jgi:probable HAF family extracellular repeat protein
VEFQKIRDEDGMHTQTLKQVAALSLLAALTMTPQLFAQDNPNHKPRHHQYKLYDMGTLGGPNSNGSQDAISLTSAGVIGGSDTPAPDPFAPNCFSSDCFVKHAIVGRRGHVTDLGALPGNDGNNSSYAFTLNNSGLIAGISENGAIDPATGFPEVNAVVWQDGRINNLGTFGGTQSAAEDMNDRGQVVGVSTNAIPDPFSFGGDPFPATTQTRALLWDRGVSYDLGTLGGPDAFARRISQSGLVAGWSYTNSTPNPTTGVPTVDPFLWKNGRMIDLGSLGGTSGSVWGVNNQGQVTGLSNLAGDQLFHGFLWDRGVLRDLPPVSGGSLSGGLWINEAGDVVGGSSIAGDQLFHAPLWTHGTAIDLGTVGQDACSQAYGINSSKQVVGNSGGSGQCDAFQNGRAFLWENGGPMVDLNALVKNPSDLRFYWAVYISENGEIAGNATLPNGDIHLVVLVPDGDCDERCEQRIADSQKISVGQPTTLGEKRPAFGKRGDWLRYPPGPKSLTPSH